VELRESGTGGNPMLARMVNGPGSCGLKSCMRVSLAGRATVIMARVSDMIVEWIPYPMSEAGLGVIIPSRWFSFEPD
jgi:hypothetical protein